MPFTPILIKHAGHLPDGLGVGQLQ